MKFKKVLLLTCLAVLGTVTITACNQMENKTEETMEKETSSDTITDVNGITDVTEFIIGGNLISLPCTPNELTAYETNPSEIMPDMKIGSQITAYESILSDEFTADIYNNSTEMISIMDGEITRLVIKPTNQDISFIGGITFDETMEDTLDKLATVDGTKETIEDTIRVTNKDGTHVIDFNYTDGKLKEVIIHANMDNISTMDIVEEK